ncbi:MAG: hypothetical protein ABFR02_07615, partial [Campylobacterota bacterium]
MNNQNHMTVTAKLIAAMFVGYIVLWVTLAAFIGALFMPLYFEWYVYLTLFFLVLAAVERTNKEIIMQDAKFKAEEA